MTEQEYINTANLARIRAAKCVLSDFHPGGDGPRSVAGRFATAMGALHDLEDYYIPLVETTEEEGTEG